MSGNRANSAAIQRRTSSSSSSTSPSVSKVQSKSSNSNQFTQPQYVPQQPYVPQQQQYIPPQQFPTQQPLNPKLSFSDAIALITIRLGRVETFINNLPPLDQIEQYASTTQPENNENMKIVDEAVFKNIISRLDKLEQTKTPVIPVQAPQVNHLSNEEIQQLKEENHSFKEQINSFKEEMDDLKNLILQLQNYTMNTNQKLCDIIFSSENEEKNISEELSKLLSHSETEMENGLDEYLSASLKGIMINEVDETAELECQNIQETQN